MCNFTQSQETGEENCELHNVSRSPFKTDPFILQLLGDLSFRILDQWQKIKPQVQDFATCATS